MEQTNEKSSYLLAILAGFGLALIGGAVYGFLYYVGYIAYLGAYLIFVLASVGIKKVMKTNKLEKRDYFVVTLISIVVTALAMLATLVITISTEAGIGIAESFNYVIELMENPDFLSALISDFVFDLLCIIVGVITVAIADKRRAKREQSQIS